MELKDYPGAIAKVQGQILQLEQEIIGLAESVNLFSALIDKGIAFDDTLKNEAQRQAARLEQQQSDPDYYQALMQLTVSKQRREQLGIELELLRNSFVVAKLEMRSRTAFLEAQAA